ncbi:MAG: hypothetical protein Q8S53_13615 [Brevundimonas sp.]|uniref:hypothetical protein n=1 Tax=Brevundimonas sp. TaxID=1871086 RepID=UPI0027375717|nr:hypothetical protein [Brevundimonas sp.]MDP3379396.1 hypothetical protein [Brevundimonas sp.]
MRKVPLLLAVASSLAFAPAAFAAEPETRQPATPETRYAAPAPQAADRSTLAEAHGVATPADQQKTAGRVPLPAVLVGTAVLVGVIVVFSS